MDHSNREQIYKPSGWMDYQMLQTGKTMRRNWGLGESRMADVMKSDMGKLISIDWKIEIPQYYYMIKCK